MVDEVAEAGLTVPGERRFQPSGVRFYDQRSQREMLLIREPGHESDGWLCYQHADGQWVTLRRATGRDLLNIKMANKDQAMELPRTDEQIVARIKEIGPEDMHGVERSRLLEALPYAKAKQFLGADAPHTEETWEVERTKNAESATAQIKGYLEFAWGKANDSRGLSAQRSMAHFKGLLYLIGPEQDDLRQWIGSPEHFAYYGKPALVKVSELVGFPWRDHDDGEWRNVPEGDEDSTSITADEAISRGAIQS